MLKSLFATCLTALSINTQPLAVPRSIEPSRAISEGTTFNVGDKVLLNYVFQYANSLELTEILLLHNSDNALPQLNIISYDVVSHLDYLVQYSNSLSSIDSCVFSLSSNSPGSSIFITDSIDDSDTLTILVPFETLASSTIDAFNVSIIFEILEGFEGFSTEALPYLTKVEKPYTPPSKSNLYRLLYDFYYSIFNDDDLTSINTSYNMPFDNWLAHTCTIATLITLIVVAFFFLRWLFKVISGLILLKR